MKETIEFISAAVYSVFLSIVSWKPRRVVLYYHAVSNKDAKMFRKQMRCLAKGKYRVTKVSEIKDAPINGAKLVVAVTFDDAFQSVEKNAVTVLEELGLKASIFVPMGYLGRHPGWLMEDNCIDQNEIVMGERQIMELSKKDFEILSHTISHPVLTNVGNDEMKFEMSESKQLLERIVGHEVIGVSYPYGAYDERVCKVAQEVGYRLGFTNEPYVVDDSVDDMKIGRFAVSAKDSVIKFRLKMCGAYEVTKYLRALKRKLIRK